MGDRLRRLLRDLLRDPGSSATKIVGRIAPSILQRRHARRSAAIGLARPYFILSFDCDTDRDIDVVQDVHARLGAVGITPVYAVPGELLERGASQYRALADRGAEFLNHGYREHTRYDRSTRTYVSTLFYEQMTSAEIEEDVRRGHDAVNAVVGKAPIGFRTPHFGGYQAPEQLEFLYVLLAGLGYRYSTSTTPDRAMMRGPAYRTHGLWEIPVSGGFRWPFALLDSYGFRYHPGRRINEADYVREMRSILAFFLRPGRAAVLNYYADPSQVYDWPEFFETMAMAAPLAAPSYGALLEALPHDR